MSEQDPANQNMTIVRAGSTEAVQGPADYFTGNVRIDRMFNAPEPARLGMAVVTFEPGARTNWHTHPLGQLLVVTDLERGGFRTGLSPGTGRKGLSRLTGSALSSA